MSPSPGRSAASTHPSVGGDEDEDPELVAASHGAGDATAAAEAASQQRGRSAASMSSDRSADRSLDDLEDASAGNATGSLKKEKKKEKSKSGLLKGLFGSKKHKVRDVWEHTGRGSFFLFPVCGTFVFG